ncbi:hypothetical protein [Halomarina rubra]|uniref:Uncharacterized protein n=1 Tax=Halomarina rubra TaxID=2071873 RepID=A0ABD6B298_9EURY|nr:hypothetical protein [Halomarina rubra]
MLAMLFQTLLVFAFLGTWVTLTRKLDERLAAFPTMVIWAVLSVSAFNVQQDAQSFQQPALAFLCVGGAILMAIFGLAAVLGKLPDKNATRFASETLGDALRDSNPERERSQRYNDPSGPYK